MKSSIVCLLLVFAIQTQAQDVSPIRVSWDANTESDLKGYKVYRGKESGVYHTIVDVGDTTSYTITNLLPNTKYYFAVTAYDSSGNESDFSNEVNAITRIVDKTPPAPPGGIKIGVIGLMIGAFGLIAFLALLFFFSSFVKSKIE